jgi:hypothetical protein
MELAPGSIAVLSCVACSCMLLTDCKLLEQPRIPIGARNVAHVVDLPRASQWVFEKYLNYLQSLKDLLKNWLFPLRQSGLEFHIHSIETNLL